LSRITIALDAESRTRLRRIAAERDVSMTALIPEAIDPTIEQQAPRPRSLGVGASGTEDTARRAGDGRPEPHASR
jgi:predicted transcriptional regulator